MAAPSDFTPSDGDSAPTTCVLWTAAAAAPAPLKEILARRGFALQTASDRFSVMAAACSAARSGRRTVVVLDQPDRLAGSQDLIEALQGRLPEALIWRYDPRATPPLGALDARPVTPAGRGAQGQPPAPTPLRLVGEPEPAGEASPAAEDESDEVDRRSILSAEELEMLLADDFDHKRGKR